MKRLLVILVLLTKTAGAEQVRVTVYDEVGIPTGVRESAIHHLKRILRQSGIDLVWVDGSLDADEASLSIYPGKLHQGREQEMMCRARRDIALKISLNAEGLPKAALGIAQPLAPSGINARVFDEPVRAAAERWNRPYDLVLAHAIAHEIGHVLLRSDSHAARGLMGPAWSAYEYGWMNHGLMFFTAEQSRIMRATLRNEFCAQVSVSINTNSSALSLRH